MIYGIILAAGEGKRMGKVKLTLPLGNKKLIEWVLQVAKSTPLDKWWEDKIADYFLVEADGAAGRSVKAPASHEPVIPLSTTDLIGVIGIDALGLSLQEENVFRSQIFSRLTGLNLGEKVGIEALAFLIFHPQGLFKNAPLHSKCHLFINKVDNEIREKLAEELVTQILRYNKKRIDDIIIGATHQVTNPVIEVIKRVK